MKPFVTALLLVALVALAMMSFAPVEWVGVRSGLGSVAGIVTAVALLAVAAVGGRIWYREKRHRHD